MKQATNLMFAVGDVKHMPFGQASKSAAARVILTHKPIVDAIYRIACACERNFKNWPAFDERGKIAEVELIWLIQEKSCSTDNDVVKLAGYELKRRVRQALGIDDLEVETSETKAARSYEAKRKKRIRDAKNDPEKIARYGCEEDEEMRHKKAASNLRRPKSLEGDGVVKDTYGRATQFGSTNGRGSWLDADTDGTGNVVGEDD